MAERTADRERHRTMAAKPFEELDEAARKGGDGKGSGAAKQAAMTALAGAVAAGLAGAAKAILDRRGEDDASEVDRDDGDDPKSRDEEQARVHSDGDEETREADEERDEEPSGEAEAADEREDSSEAEPQAQSESQSDEPAAEAAKEPVEGVSGGEAKAVADRAREELQELLGVEPERVSGFERADGGWTVTLEVVDVRRIPESTDVLASYDVTLDDDRKLVSVAQTRRYRRSQVEGS
jgi:Gas vesicle synthesis protein GvpO